MDLGPGWVGWAIKGPVEPSDLPFADCPGEGYILVQRTSERKFCGGHWQSWRLLLSAGARRVCPTSFHQNTHLCGQVQLLFFSVCFMCFFGRHGANGAPQPGIRSKRRPALPRLPQTVCNQQADTTPVTAGPVPTKVPLSWRPLVVGAGFRTWATRAM